MIWPALEVPIRAWSLLIPHCEDLKMKNMTDSFYQKAEDKKWHVIDLNEEIVGRVAQRIAVLLRGKHSARFVPVKMITFALGISLQGLAARSTPNAILLAAPALTMQSLPL